MLCLSIPIEKYLQSLVRFLLRFFSPSFHLLMHPETGQSQSNLPPSIRDARLSALKLLINDPTPHREQLIVFFDSGLCPS